jgi:hypothetical protein
MCVVNFLYVSYLTRCATFVKVPYGCHPELRNLSAQLGDPSPAMSFALMATSPLVEEVDSSRYNVAKSGG